MEMANRRMIAKSVCATEGFFALSAGAQALFYQLQLDGDEYGFIANPRQVMRSCCRGEEELRELITAGYLLVFEDTGHAVMAHWRAANRLTNSACKPLNETEFARLQEIDGCYTLRSHKFAELRGNSDTIQHQPRDNSTSIETQLNRPTLAEVAAEVKKRDYHVDPADFLRDCEDRGWRDNEGRPILNWRGWLRTWAQFKAGMGKPPALAFDQRQYTHDELSALTDAGFEEAAAALKGGDAR